ncbi:MAG: ATP-binding protein, partial [Ignavibacteria bacterium]|nr:ATP-binding protein [Ignavibacteria bacterium]
MIYKRFRLQVTLRVLLLAASIFGIAWLNGEEKYFVSVIILALLVVLQVISLIFYTERTNRRLAKFFESVRHADFSSSFSEKGLGKSFD